VTASHGQFKPAPCPILVDAARSGSSCPSSIARRAFHLGLVAQGVPLIVAELGTDAQSWILHIFAALAEKERIDINARTTAALKAAKARGVRLGNPRLEEARAAAMTSVKASATPLWRAPCHGRGSAGRRPDAAPDRGAAEPVRRGVRAWRAPTAAAGTYCEGLEGLRQCSARKCLRDLAITARKTIRVQARTRTPVKSGGEIAKPPRKDPWGEHNRDRRGACYSRERDRTSPCVSAGAMRGGSVMTNNPWEAASVSPWKVVQLVVSLHPGEGARLAQLVPEEWISRDGAPVIYRTLHLWSDPFDFLRSPPEVRVRKLREGRIPMRTGRIFREACAKVDEWWRAGRLVADVHPRVAGVPASRYKRT
jgi:hypothetical protein